MEREWAFAPHWCGLICTNHGNELCAESCAIKRNCEAFEIKPELTELPVFPLQEFLNEMTAGERMTVVAIHLLYLEGGLNPPTETIDLRHLKFDREKIDKIMEKRNHGHQTFKSEGSSRVPRAIEINRLQPHSSKGDPLHSFDREKVSSERS